MAGRDCELVHVQRLVHIRWIVHISFSSGEGLNPSKYYHRIWSAVLRREKELLSYPFSEGVELISCALYHLVSGDLWFGFIDLRLRQASIS